MVYSLIWLNPLCGITITKIERKQTLYNRVFLFQIPKVGAMTRIPSFNTAAFFLFFGEISPTGDQKKPSATSRKEF